MGRVFWMCSLWRRRPLSRRLISGVPHQILLWNEQLDNEQCSDIGQSCPNKKAGVTVVALKHVADYVRGQDASHSATEASHAGYRTYCRTRENIGSEREDVSRPALMRCHGETDYANRDPKAMYVAEEHDGH